jgi:hypothetical protein
MNKTGPQLLELSPKEGIYIQEKYVAADTLYSQIKEDVKKRAVVLDEAISQSTQVILSIPGKDCISPHSQACKAFSWTLWSNFLLNDVTGVTLKCGVFSLRGGICL